MKKPGHNKVKKFENKVSEYLKKYFPEHCAELGDVAVLESVRDGVCRCEKYGINLEQDVTYYLYHMYAINFDFDQTENVWVKDILQNNAMSVSERLDKISDYYEDRLTRETLKRDFGEYKLNNVVIRMGKPQANRLQ